MNRRFILLVLFFVALVVYFGYLLPQRQGIHDGDVAPVFALPNAQGEMQRLSDYRGKTVLLNFWATWCPPCVWEMPSLNHLRKILAKEAFEVIAVSIDEGGWPVIQAFQKRVSLAFPVLLDITTEVAALYGTYQLPESYLIGPDGMVIKKYLGPREWDREDMIAEIKAHMAQYESRRGTL